MRCTPTMRSRGLAVYLLDKPVEEIQRVVRSWPCLGVVLDRRTGDVSERESLDGTVIQVDVRQLGGPEVRLPTHRLIVLDRPGAARTQDREAVILAGDLGNTGGQVLDRMVRAVVTERELVRLQP